MNGIEVTEHIRLVEDGFANLLETLIQTRALLSGAILEFGEVLSKTLYRGNKILVAGNGGSAADAQHFAAELTGRFKIPQRRALPVITLNADPILLTAWANDFNYDTVFSRQVEAYGQPGDAMLLITTSGKSKNLIEAAKVARRRGITCLALTGKDGGDISQLADHVIIIPSMDTARIQEVHILILHLICELIELDLFKLAAPPVQLLDTLTKTGTNQVDYLIPMETSKSGRANGNAKRPISDYSNSKKNGDITNNEKLGWKSNSSNRRGTGLR